MSPETEVQFDYYLPETQTQSSARAFWTLAVAIGLMSMSLYFFGMKLPAIGLVGVFLAFSALIAPRVGMYLYFLWQALDSVFLTSIEASFTPAKALSLFILLTCLISYNRIRQRIMVSKPIIISMFLFGLWGLLVTPMALSPKTSLRYSLQILIQTALAVFAIYLFNNRRRVYFAFLCCFLSGIICSTAMMITGGVSRNFERATLGEYANPVTTALALSLSLISVVGLWSYKKNKLYYLAYIAGSLMILYEIMKTGTRAALLALFLALGFGTLFADKVSITKRILIPVVLVVLSGLSVSYILSMNVLSEKSQERLTVFTSGKIAGEGEYSGDRSRTYIWKRGINTYLQHRPLTGFGFGNTGHAIQKYWGEYRGIHSSILEPLVDSGPIGFILFMYALILLFLKSRNINNSRIKISAMMFFIFTVSSLLAHSIHFSKWFWIPLTLCLLLIEQDAREQQGQDYSNEEYAVEFELFERSNEFQ